MLRAPLASAMLQQARQAGAGLRRRGAPFASLGRGLFVRTTAAEAVQRKVMALGADPATNSAVEAALHSAGFGGRCFVVSNLESAQAELAGAVAAGEPYDLVVLGGAMPSYPAQRDAITRFVASRSPSTRLHQVALSDYKASPATATAPLNTVAVARRLLARRNPPFRVTAIGVDAATNAAVETALRRAGYDSECFVAPGGLGAARAALAAKHWDLVIFGGGMPVKLPAELASFQAWLAAQCPNTKWTVMSDPFPEDTPKPFTPAVVAGFCVAAAHRLLPPP